VPTSPPPPSPAVLTVVVVHRDQPVRCATTVAVLQASSLPAGVDLRVVVVDNGSQAPSLARLHTGLEAAAAPVEVLELGVNAGFGPGANAGLRRALADGADVVGVAPHDALVAPDCLALLLEALGERPGAGLVSADVGDGLCPVVDPYFGAIGRARDREVGWEDCGHPHGTLFLARAACLADVGLFDERYFAYGEEADLGVRASRAGWGVGIVHGARVTNPELGGTDAAVDYLMSRNTLLLVREHFGRYRAGVRTVWAVGQLAAGIARPSRRPWIFSARGRAWALVDHARGRHGPPPAHLFQPPRPLRPRAGRGVGARG